MWIAQVFETPHLMWIGPMKFNVVPAKAFEAMYWVKTATRAHPLRPLSTR